MLIDLFFPQIIKTKHSNSNNDKSVCLVSLQSSDLTENDCLFVRLIQTRTRVQTFLVYPQLSLHFIGQDLPVFITPEHLKLNCAQMFEYLTFQFVQLLEFWHGHISLYYVFTFYHSLLLLWRGWEERLYEPGALVGAAGAGRNVVAGAWCTGQVWVSLLVTNHRPILTPRLPALTEPLRDTHCRVLSWAGRYKHLTST